ncbi:MAG TPA: M20/M25/M40 family metallo-hydrolase [Candidatus Acidoferrales bacterium]|nr:M20/M25/M40 family metallo-hydrolase [Candidatus Acidoferrales bacterium]
MTMRMAIFMGLFLLLSTALYADGPQKSTAPGTGRDAAAVAAAVRAYRISHQYATMREFTDFLAIPNIASDAPNIARNAERLSQMLEARGIHVQLLALPGRGPLVFAEVDTPGATRTVIFYAHYDGQPVDAAVWIGNKPFEPVLFTGALATGGKQIPFPQPPARYEDDWRIYARSASDDKAAIVAILTALDALRASKISLGVNVKLLFDSEEEAGSPHLEQAVSEHRALLAGDLLLVCDGPADQSGREQVVFGNRGVVDAEITVYGPARPLHSGHYGNWAPNPAMRLAQLLATMKDAEGRVLIAGFYDDVAPAGDLERKAMAEAPKNEAALQRELGIAQPDGGGKRLVELIAEPSLNIRGLRSAYVGEQSQNVVPDRAVASLDMRLVKNIQPERQIERLIAHIEKQGYTVFRREPTLEERGKYPRVARVDSGGGYPATHTSMELPVAAALVEVVAGATGEAPVKLPTMGGSVPMFVFERLGLPVIGMPIANYDNSQHAANENIRLGNLWRGMETFGAILAALSW